MFRQQPCLIPSSCVISCRLLPSMLLGSRAPPSASFVGVPANSRARILEHQLQKHASAAGAASPLSVMRKVRFGVAALKVFRTLPEHHELATDEGTPTLQRP